MNKRREIFDLWFLKPDRVRKISGLLSSLCWLVEVFIVIIGVFAVFTQNINLNTGADYREGVPLLFSNKNGMSANCSLAEIRITAPNGIDFITWLGVALIVITTAAAILLFIINLGSILKSVEKNEIFTSKNAERILLMGISLIMIYPVLPLFYSYVLKNMVNLFSGNRMWLTYKANISTLFFGFVTLILAFIFRYGVHLQDEYDHTL